MLKLKKEQKIAEQEALRSVVFEFGKCPMFFGLEKNTFFGFSVGAGFYGYTYSLADTIATKVDYVKVKIARADAKTRHIYLCLEDVDYYVEVTSVVDAKDAAGCDSSLYGAVTFRHNLPNVQFGSKVLVRFVKTKARFEAVGIDFWK